MLFRSGVHGDGEVVVAHLSLQALLQPSAHLHLAVHGDGVVGEEGRREEGEALDVEGGKAVEGSPWRMSSRLQERLGYLGVFYKRDPSRFLSNLPAEEQQELLKSLQRTYRDLLLSYFRDPAAANQALESFVNTAFFGDLPITRAVEIHMNLIDDFWKKLRLEGHKNDFLQDYRLALLDVMAHLCEMYRRSIPTEAQLAASSATTVVTDLEVSS